jgi:hypothetical protein
VNTLNAAAGSPGDPPDAASAAEQRAREMLRAGDVGKARQAIQEALGFSPGRPDLLWVLADVEFADGDEQAAARCLTEAVIASGEDAAAIGKKIQALSDNRLLRGALDAVEHVPPRVLFPGVTTPTVWREVISSVGHLLGSPAPED